MWNITLFNVFKKNAQTSILFFKEPTNDIISTIGDIIKSCFLNDNPNCSLLFFHRTPYYSDDENNIISYITAYLQK